MKPRRYLSTVFSRALTSPRRRDAFGRLSELRRRARGAPHRVEYFHQVDDPYSQLAAQALRALLGSYEIELVPHLVGPPSDAAASERELLRAYARKDASDVASGYGIAFEDRGKQPAAAQSRLAQRILAGAPSEPGRAEIGFPEIAVAVGAALWSDDVAALAALAKEHGAASESATEQQLDRGNARRRRLRHYLGGMFWYGGEWFWGVDRLHHMERRLIALGAVQGERSELRFAQPTGSKPSVRDDGTVTLEYFPSLRSPYTAISMRSTFELVRESGVKLSLRPVLPMVMRGVPAPLPKALYIMMDTKREAEFADTRFGNMCDPLGEPVKRGFSLFPWAREQGKAQEYLLSFVEGAFADGIDTGSDEGLQRVVERIGLSWTDARKIVDNRDWEDELEQNRVAMYGMGLWGVPSFRLIGPDGQADFATWGQDRLWLLEREIKRRLEAGHPQL